MHRKFLYLIIFFTLECFGSDLLCSDWLRQTLGNAPNIEGSNCNGDPQYNEGDHRDCHYTLSDSIGAKGVCRDFFPTWGEREMFYRDSSDPFKFRLFLVREYCWARNIWNVPHDNCGKPNCNPFWPFGCDWANGVQYTSWGNVKKVEFSIDEIGPNNTKTILWGSNYAYIDYKKYPDGSINPKFICAYFTTSWIGKVATSDREIGCIQIPLYPGPPVFNKILIPKKAVNVSSDTPEDSTFDKPKIFLEVKDSAGHTSGRKHTLTYDFEKKHDQQECSVILEESFCPIVKFSEPSKICAYPKNRPTDILGCIDRPNPAASGMTIEAIHDYYIDHSCNDENKNSAFHAIKIKLTLPNQKSKIYPNTPIREYYACSKSVNQGGKSITNTTSGFDSYKFFGVKLGAIIPEFDKSGNFKKVHLEALEIEPNTNTDSNSYDQACSKCFAISSDKKAENYILPAGQRDRTSCKQKYTCKFASGSSYQKCTFGFNNQFSEAEKVYCPGVYKQQPQVSKDKICINLLSNWPNFFSDTDKICADIVENYINLDKNNISPNTNYVDFSDDGYEMGKKYSQDKKFYGKCLPSLNLENSYSITESVKNLKSLNQNEILNLKQIILYFEDTLSRASFKQLTSKQLQLLGFNVTKNIIGTSKSTPYRTLNDNMPIGEIHGSCKFQSGEQGCLGNEKDTASFLGNAYFPTPKLTIGAVLKENKPAVISKNLGLSYVDVPVYGTCNNSSSKPKRTCRVIIDTKTSKIITKSWTDEPITTNCN